MQFLGGASALLGQLLPRSGGGAGGSPSSSPQVNAHISVSTPFHISVNASGSGGTATGTGGSATGTGTGGSADASSSSQAAAAAAAASQPRPALASDLEQGLRDVNDLFMRLLQQAAPHFVPTGGIVDFAGQACPQGWLECDGSEYQTSQYPELAAILGSTLTATTRA